MGTPREVVFVVVADHRLIKRVLSISQQLAAKKNKVVSTYYCTSSGFDRTGRAETTYQFREMKRDSEKFIN